jgi:diguanylate cyclase (GGDEF)-like protein
VFLASPSDLLEERAAVAGVVTRLNHQIAAPLGLTIELVRWEDILPGIGREAQEVINRETGDCDVYVVILWTRIGTPTQSHESGTVEEFVRAYNRWLTDKDTQVLVYFSTRPFYPKFEDLTELKRLFHFRQSLAEKGVLYYQFAKTLELEEKLSDHLTLILLRRADPLNASGRAQLLYSLPSHRHFHGAASDLLQKGYPFGIIYLDFDNFTELKNSLLVETKDPKVVLQSSTEVLSTLAKIVFDTVGHRGHLYRYSGDEFAVLVANRDGDEIRELAEEIRSVVEATQAFWGVKITASIGVGWTPPVPGYELFMRVYDAVFAAKLTGKNRVVACPLTREQIVLIEAAHARGHS